MKKEKNEKKKDTVKTKRKDEETKWRKTKLGGIPKICFCKHEQILKTWMVFQNQQTLFKNSEQFSNKTNNILNAKKFKHDFSRMCTEFWNA